MPTEPSVLQACHDGEVPHELPPDREVPALRVLLSDAASEVLAAAGEAAGFRLEDATVSQVRYVPARYVIVQYNTRLTDSSGKTSAPMLVATSGLEVPDGTLTLSTDEVSVAVWRFPRDPFLPGLDVAVQPSAVVDLLTRLGAPTQAVQLRVRAYRASRRAVIQAHSDSGTIYMKVVRPNRVEALQRRHIAMGDHVPIPQSLGWSKELGIVAMEALGGQTLRQAVEAGQRDLPSPQALVALLDQFPPPTVGAPTVKGAYERSGEHARLIGAVLPRSRGMLEEIRAGISAAAVDEPVRAVHGDFHGSQILVDEGRIVGLVDVDTAGVGQRTDDLANVVGHLATLASVSRNPLAINAYLGELLREWDLLTNPVVLRLRVAAVVLGLATGPFRVQSPDWPGDTLRRLDLAREWIAASHRL